MSPGPAPVRTRTTREIAADPTSTALLLSGPAALELWPGVRRVGEVDGLALVETDLPSARRTAATVRALPPRRTPTAYVTRFAWSGPELPGASGELRLSYSGVGDTLAELDLTVEVVESELDAGVLQEQADAFLENLRKAAEERSDAA